MEFGIWNLELIIETIDKTLTKHITILLLSVALLWMGGMSSFAQTAPVTSLGIVTDAVPGPVTVPMEVTGFNNIGQFTLTFTYESACMSYMSYTANPIFSGLTVTHSSAGGQGKLVINWPGNATNYSLPDDSQIMSFTFDYDTSTSYLTWSYTFDICRYRTYSGGNYITLSDSPKLSYYIKGGISERGAPVISAPMISGAVPGSVSVPVTVTDFYAIQAFSLSLEYDMDVLTYVSCTPNPTLSGSFYVGNQLGPNGKMMVTPGWLGLKTLADGSILFTIVFTFSNAINDYSALHWMDNGPSCEFTARNFKLIDFPYADYYNNGFVQEAPASTVSVAGTVFKDMDRMTDNTVDGEGTNVNGSMHVNLVNDLNNVVATSDVGPDGTYLFSSIAAGNYTVQLSINAGIVGSPMPVTALPATWINTGEHLGAGAGDDGNADGLLAVVVGTTDIIAANFGIVDVPDLTPVLTVAPNVMNGVTSFSIEVRITELNSVVTDGLITARITKDPRWAIQGSLSNPNWSYSGTDPNYHIFTTSSAITAGGSSVFTFNALWSAGQTTGYYTITLQIDSNSGGEVKINNNTDAEKIDYFIS